MILVQNGQISRGELDAFAEVSGDTNPIHLDETAARRAGFKTVVVQGMLIVQRLLSLIPSALLSAPTERLLIDARFRQPLYPDQRWLARMASDGDLAVTLSELARPSVSLVEIRLAPPGRAANSVHKLTTPDASVGENTSLLCNLAAISRFAGTVEPGFGSLIGRARLSLSAGATSQRPIDYPMDVISVRRFGHHVQVRFQTPNGSGEYHSIMPRHENGGLK